MVPYESKQNFFFFFSFCPIRRLTCYVDHMTVYRDGEINGILEVVQNTWKVHRPFEIPST